MTWRCPHRGSRRGARPPGEGTRTVRRPSRVRVVRRLRCELNDVGPESTWRTYPLIASNDRSRGRGAPPWHRAQSRAPPQADIPRCRPHPHRTGRGVRLRRVRGRGRPRRGLQTNHPGDDPLDALDPMGTSAFAEDPRRCAAPRGRRRRGIRRDPRRRTDEGRRCRAGSRRGSLPLGQAVRPARLEKNPRAEALAQGHPHHVRTVLRAHLAAVQRVADRVLLRRVRSRVAGREALLHRQRFDHERKRCSRCESRGRQVRAAQGPLHLHARAGDHHRALLEGFAGRYRGAGADVRRGRHGGHSGTEAWERERVAVQRGQIFRGIRGFLRGWFRHVAGFRGAVSLLRVHGRRRWVRGWAARGGGGGVHGGGGASGDGGVGR